MPELTESTILERVGDASFERGRRYFRNGAIFNPRRQGQTLKALCQGSIAQPYRVEVILGPQGIVSANCSCPVGAGGYCKHTAALLLTWLHNPGDFAEVENLETALARRSQAELIALIRKMIARYPDLETLLELPTAGGAEAKPIAPDIVRRQVTQAFHGMDYEGWGAAYGISQDLLQVVDLGDEYAAQGGWRNAITVYETVAREILEQYETMGGNDEGEIADVVNDCVSGLGRCFPNVEDTALRESLLRALFDVYAWDVNFGGIGIGDESPEIILEHANAEEKRLVAEWVREALPAGDSWSDNYHRQVYGGFLLQLEADEMDDETFLRVCRETSRWQDLVNRLLALSRVDEATATAHQVGDYELLQLADIFCQYDHADVAERLIGERAQTSNDSRLPEWLKRRAQERGDPAAALAFAEALFWRHPDLEGYQEMRELAQPLGQWDALRATVLNRLTAQNDFELLTQVHLDEGDIEQALETVERIRWGGDGLRLRVAQAAESKHPRDAIRIYTKTAERLIDARGRDNYTTAAAYLLRVRDLYRSLEEQSTWEGFIADLRERNRSLRALKEELIKAGL
jgi:uncharacterized Zn finger protein